MKSFSSFVLLNFRSRFFSANYIGECTQNHFFNIFCILLLGLSANAQIISNPDFETFTLPCPSAQSQFNSKVAGWTAPLNGGGAGGTPDYFNSCGSYNLASYSPSILPYSGSGFAGIYLENNSSPAFTDYKEYISNQLSAPLVAGVTYVFSFYTAHLFGAPITGSPAASLGYQDLPDAEQGFLGAVFSVAAPLPINTGNGSGGSPRFNSIRNDFGSGRALIPKINTSVYGTASQNKWVHVTLYYTAVGGEQYMTIGQFRPGGTSVPVNYATYYLFDNFSLAVAPLPNCTQAGAFDTLGLPSATGVSDLNGFSGGINGWPANVANGHLVVESKKKGFVITRVSSSAAITDAVEGMLIYDITAKCVKLYNGATWKCLAKDCL